jgi:hypothetical protein
MFFDCIKFLVTISLISSIVCSLSSLFLTSISTILELLSRELLRVIAFESSIKLHEISSYLIDLFYYMNLARLSQNM